MNLQENLSKHGFKEKYIVSDNNCQFHAIIDQCLQNGIVGWNHMSLRSTAVKWLQDNKHSKIDDIPIHELFSLTESRLCALQQHSKVWGDEATLFAMAQILKATVIVYSSINDVYTIKCYFSPPKYTFHIGYYNNIHYVSTLPIPYIMNTS